MKHQLLLLGLFFLNTELIANAQKRTEPQRSETDKPASIGFRVGPSLLFGDLKDGRSSWMAGGQLTIPLNRLLSVELLGDAGRLKAEQEAFYHSRSDCRFVQSSLVGAVDLLRLFSKQNRLTEVTCYGGTGLMFFRASAYDLTTNQLQRLTNNANSYRTRDGIKTRGNPGVRNTHELVFPLGLRISSPLSRQVSVVGDVRFSLVRSDKLDATLDGNNRTLANGAAQTEQVLYRNNSLDRFATLSVGLVYYFGDRKN